MRLTDHSADFLTKHPGIVTLALSLLTCVAIYGHFYQPPPSNRLAEEANSEPSEPSEGATKDEHARYKTERADQAGSRMQLARGRNPHAIIVIETDEAFTPHGVKALRQIAAKLEELPQVDEVTWIDNIPTLNVFGLRENLLPPEDASQEAFDIAREESLDHPLMRGQLVSEDGRTLLMTIVLDWAVGPSDEECSSDLLASAKKTAATAGFQANISITGLIPLYIAHKVAFDRNRRWFQNLSHVLVAVVSILLFRGISAVCIVAIAPAIGIFWTLGVLNLIDDRSNQLTNIVLPVLLTMVGLADGVHLMVHIRRRRAEGVSSSEAAASAIRNVGAACALTSLTTAVGFGSLMIAESEFVQDFGRACALGVLITFVSVITVIPLLCMTPFAKNIHVGHERDVVGAAMERFTPLVNWIMGRSGWISLASILVTILLAVSSLQLRADDKMKDNQPTGSAEYQALEHCDRELGGIETIRVNIAWPAGVTSREALEAISTVEQIVDEEPLLKHPLSILGILDSLPGDDPVVERAGFVDLLPAQVRRSWFDTEARQARVTVRIRDLGIAKYEPVFQQLENRFEKMEAEQPGYRFELGGSAVRRGRDLYKIVLDLARSLGTASIIIFIMMALAYRSLRIGLISVVPNLFPLVVTATVLVLMGLPLEIASVCSFTVCLGIAVDDTIHFLTRFRSELEQSQDLQHAIRRSFVGVGTAMVITTLIMMVGFGTVLGSDMPSHRSFSAMAVSTIGSALIGDLLFLPALLARFGKPLVAAR